jgi:hypothetical protein
MATEPSVRDLEDLGYQRFEELIASLVFAKHERAERLAAPDGGADILTRADADSVATVWQVKHHTSRINWRNCALSLDRAVECYAPDEVVFVFPRDLTKPQRDQFMSSLSARHPRITVIYWGLQHLRELLADLPGIARRYFGSDQADLLPAVLRAVEHGSNIDTLADVVRRAASLDQIADSLDPNFEYEITFGVKDKLLEWSPGDPLLMMPDDPDNRTEVRIRPRPGVTGGVFQEFTEDPAGRRALAAVREAFAAGERITVFDGIELYVAAPAPGLLQETLEKSGSPEGNSIGLFPSGETYRFSLAIPGVSESCVFDARPLPGEGANGSYGCIRDGLGFYCDFDEPTAEPGAGAVKVEGRIELKWHRDGEAPVDIAALATLCAFHAADAVTVECEDLHISTSSQQLRGSGARLKYYEFWLRGLAAVRILELQGRSVEVPHEVTNEEFLLLAEAATLMSGVDGSFTAESCSFELVQMDLDALTRWSARLMDVELEVFNSEISLGTRLVDLPEAAMLTADPDGVDGPVSARLCPSASVVRCSASTKAGLGVGRGGLWIPPKAKGARSRMIVRPQGESSFTVPDTLEASEEANGDDPPAHDPGWAGDVPESAADLEARLRAADVDGDANGSMHLGNVLRDRGDKAEAEAAYRRAINRGSADAAWHLGGVLEGRKDLKGAEDAFRLGMVRGSAKAATCLADLLLKRRDHKLLPEIREVLRTGDELGSGVSAHVRGVILKEDGDLEEAEAALRRAVGRGEGDAAVEWGLLCDEKDDSEAALKAFGFGDSLGSARASELYAERLDAVGRPQQARAARRRAAQRLKDLASSGAA